MPYARKPAKDDKIALMIWGRENGKCAATRGEWGDQSANRCNKPAESVWIDPDGIYVVLCKSCRISGIGFTSGEKRVSRERNKNAQTELIPGITGKHKVTPHE